MSRRGSAAQTLLAKIAELPPARVAEVEDFVEFLRQREADRRLARAASKLSERSFAKVWNNAADAVYDEL
jgi:MoxR-like ATPase